MLNKRQQHQQQRQQQRAGGIEKKRLEQQSHTYIHTHTFTVICMSSRQTMSVPAPRCPPALKTTMNKF